MERTRNGPRWGLDQVHAKFGFMRKLPLFDSVGDGDLRTLAQQLKHKRFRKNSVVLNQV